MNQYHIYEAIGRGKHSVSVFSEPLTRRLSFCASWLCFALFWFGLVYFALLCFPLLCMELHCIAAEEAEKIARSSQMHGELESGYLSRFRV